MSLQLGGAVFAPSAVEGPDVKAKQEMTGRCERGDGETNQDVLRLPCGRTDSRRKLNGVMRRMAEEVAANDRAAAVPGFDAPRPQTSKNSPPILKLDEQHRFPEDTDSPEETSTDDEPQGDSEQRFVAPQQLLREYGLSSESSPQVKPASRPSSPTSSSEAELPPLPDVDVWQHLPFRVNFRAMEELDRYILVAEVPGLCTDDVDISLSGSALRIAGCRYPAPNRAEQLRERLDARIRQLAHGSPERHQRLLAETERPEVAAVLYGELGRGEFGRFAETFRLPPDADARRLGATYDEGALRVALPKAVHVRSAAQRGYVRTAPSTRFRKHGVGHAAVSSS